MRRTPLVFFLLLLSLLPSVSMAAEQKDKATLNLEDVDIRTLIDTVSAQTGKNFVIDPRVQGKVTVISASPMNQEDLYEVFLSILQVHGFTAVNNDKIIKIVPLALAKQAPSPKKHPIGEEVVTHVIPLMHMRAAELVPVIKPMIAQSGYVSAFPSANILVISDHAANLERVRILIESMDKPVTQSIGIIHLRHATASDIIQTVNPLLQQFQKTLPPAEQIVMTADERTNSVLMSGGQSYVLKLREIIHQLDSPAQANGNTRVYYLKFAKAEDLVPILQGAVGDSKNRKGTDSKNEISIQADAANNALVITGPVTIQQSIKSIIKRLDIRRKQILVEAIIAEVDNDLSTELGIQFAASGLSNNDKAGPVGLSNIGTPNLVSLAQSAMGGQADLNLGPGFFLGGGRLSGNQGWLVLLKALQGDAATNILSTPNLVALDNEEAEIVVAKNVPFITGSYTSTGSGQGVTNPFQTVERKDIGLTLKVKPQINEGNSIKLEIEQEASDIAASSASTTDITTNKRSLKTSVLVNDGQILVLGGLIQDTYTNSQQKLPVVGDIPVLGNLLSSESVSKVKRNLMIFIRPTVMANQKRSDHFTQQRYQDLRQLQMQNRDKHARLVGEKANLFPPLQQVVGPQPLPPEDNKPAPIEKAKPQWRNTFLDEFH